MREESSASEGEGGSGVEDVAVGRKKKAVGRSMSVGAVSSRGRKTPLSAKAKGKARAVDTDEDEDVQMQDDHESISAKPRPTRPKPKSTAPARPSTPAPALKTRAASVSAGTTPRSRAMKNRNGVLAKKLSESFVADSEAERESAGGEKGRKKRRVA
jgi:hypothetical protein